MPFTFPSVAYRPQTAQVPLTDRQREVLLAIYRHMEQHGVPPTWREMMEALGISALNGPKANLEPLIVKGYLLPIPKGGHARTIRLAGVTLRPVIDATPAGERFEKDVLGKT